MKSSQLRLPAAVMTGWSSPASERDQATLVLSVDSDGFPRTSLLSNAEIHVVDDRHLRLALWQESRTVSNVSRSGRLTLFRIDEGVPYSIRVRCSAPVDLDVPGRPLVAVSAVVAAVDGDQVSYASMVGNLTFQLLRPTDVLPVWAAVKQALSRL